MFIGQYSSEYGLIMAGSMISLVPVIIMFVFMQKYFVTGVTTAGLKG
jgi:multiple sugar transport system permease protein